MKEHPAHCIPGLLPFFAVVILLILGFSLGWHETLADRAPWAFPVIIIALVLWLKGFFIVAPNQARVLTLFGNYTGTVRTSGIWFANPLASKQNISLKVSNFQSPQLKVNDANGNPIEIACVIVWRVVDTAQAIFDVQDYFAFIQIQCETALRHLANHFPYESSANDPSHIALRSHPEEVGKMLRSELQTRVQIAGIEVLETQLTHLAYSPEIAQAMLRRQQAQAVISARQMIVEGAVGIVEIAIRKLEADQIITLDEHSKAIMVNNLMVTLVSEQHIQPVLSTAQVKA